MPRLDEHLQLPVAGPVLVVLERRIHRNSEVALLALRPQAQVGAKHRAVRGGLGDGPGDGVRQTHGVFLVGDRRVALRAARRFAVVGVEKEQVDVRAVIELVPAQLAKRYDAEAAARDPSLRVAVLRLPVALLEFAVAEHQHVGQDHVGQRRKLQRRLPQRGKPQHVLQHNTQVVPPLESRQSDRFIES